MNELEMCKSIMEEKDSVLKKVNPELEEMKIEKNDLVVKLEAYKQIIKQKVWGFLFLQATRLLNRFLKIIVTFGLQLSSL